MNQKKKVRRMVRDMGFYTIYPKPKNSKRYHAQYKALLTQKVEHQQLKKFISCLDIGGAL
ncbi:hypothetical protein [Alkaliphilus serpentinus]|uniref:Uncharacterized protein n=1 Tax=Alkaliphilus serpentinus TaxID=1482731 RepID=A0A833MAD1_9FIRM|nr:hypothetical protein F8153_06125 [Alkaliphilus serpentinus]